MASNEFPYVDMGSIATHDSEICLRFRALLLMVKISISGRIDYGTG